MHAPPLVASLTVRVARLARTSFAAHRIILAVIAVAAVACGPKDAAPPQPDASAAAEALADARALLVVGKEADPKQALARLESTFGGAPRDPEAAFLLARAAFRAEDPARCRRALDAYFEHEPKQAGDDGASATFAHPDWSAEAWVLRGWLLERDGRPKDALPFYERALAILPDYPWALHRKGCALADSGDVEGGIAALEQAIAARPGLLEAHFSLAHLLRRAGRADDADREARIHRLLNQAGDNSANTRESVMEKFAALTELETLLPQWIEGRLLLSQMQWKLGRRELALERTRRLVAEHPESTEAKALLAQLERGAAAPDGGGR